MRLPHRLARVRRGASGSEYGLGVGLVAAVVIAALAMSGDRISGLFSSVANELGTVAATTVAGSTNTTDTVSPDDPAPAEPPESQLAKLLASDGAGNDYFGYSIAISDGTAIVGAHRDDDNGSNSGSAYLFDAATGNQIDKLTPDDGAADNRFGYSVAISGGTAIIGAYRDNDNGSSSGSAYLFDATTGDQIDKLTPNDGAANDRFGFSVAISGSTVVVGAYGDDDNGSKSGSAYLFDAKTVTQTAKLTPGDGTELDDFGRNVAISDGTAIVGATGDDDNGSKSGSAYLFDAATGNQIAKLTPDDGAAYDYFGGSVAISGSTAVVGAWRDDDNGSDSGSAYLFDAKTGTQTAKLTPDDGAENDQFGISVAISGGTAVVGAHLDDDNGAMSGSIYLFNTITGNQIAKLTPEDGASYDEFGISVAISGGTAAVGAYHNNDNGSNSGSAYLFD